MISKVHCSHQITQWHKAELKGIPGAEPSLPTSLHPAVIHPLNIAQIHFSVSQTSWITTSPTVWEQQAGLTSGLVFFCAQTLHNCSHSPVFDFPADKLDHAAHRDH